MSYYDLGISALAATVAEVSTLPICIVKTNYQNSNTDSILKTIKRIYFPDKAEVSGGLRAFYRASVPSVASQVFSTSSKYVLYRYFGKYSDYTVLNGLASGICSSLVCHPIDVIRVHKQMNTPLPSMTTKVLYRGYSKTFFKAALGSCLFFPLYDFYYKKTENSLIAGFGSAVTSTTIMQPMDYLKTRHMYGQKLYHGWNSYYTLKPYYKGLTLNLARIVPHFMITMYVIHIGTHLGTNLTEKQ